MKILMINVSCGTGSTGRICTDLASALEALEHEVKIAYGRDAVPEQFQKYAVRIGSDLDVKLHGVKARLFDASGFGSKQATKRFIKWVKEFDPDVIHLHNIHGYYINVEILFDYLKTCGKRIIWTLHDCWAFTGHTAYCDAIKCEKWKTGCDKCPQIKEYPKSYIDCSSRNWKKKNTLFSGIPNLTIITPSRWLAGLVGESFLASYPVQVINNGIDTNQFKPLSNDFRKVYNLENKFIILGVATAWDDMKGYLDFIKLADMLDESYQIVMVGLTDAQIQALSNNILGIKRTASDKELAQIYSASDVFLNLSYCENYPTVNFEARACGIPVITYKTGGSPESAGDHGILVEQGDLPEVVKRLREIKESGKAMEEPPIACSVDQCVSPYADEIRVGYFSVKEKYNLLGKYVVLGVAAIWDKRKGLEDFVKLSKLLDERYKVVIVGLTKEQVKDLPDTILGMGRTNSVAELAELYAIADVFVNPTYEDNYPTTNLEAISCGTPVITYDTGGSPESVPKQNVVPKGDFLSVCSLIGGKISCSDMPMTKSDASMEYIKIISCGRWD